MDAVRKPFQGVTNIIRFNWHFYLLSIVPVTLLFYLSAQTSGFLKNILLITCVLVIISIAVSLLVSLYVYDLSGLYKLNWLHWKNSDKGLVVNIHSGFDETSIVLKEKFQIDHLQVFDFYDPKKHTEISIRRARSAYPSYPETIHISAELIPLPDQSVEAIFVIFAAHEIRTEAERIVFFRELYRVLKPDGEIFVTEHLRDIPNFLAYTIGFFHFHSLKSWLRVFSSAELMKKAEIKPNPFITSFTLIKNGTAD